MTAHGMSKTYGKLREVFQWLTFLLRLRCFNFDEVTASYVIIALPTFAASVVRSHDPGGCILFPSASLAV